MRRPHHCHLLRAFAATAAATLVACGGGSSGNGDGTPADGGVTTFGAYAGKAGTDPGGAAPVPLSAADQAEVARRSRLWAAGALTAVVLQDPDNAVALPPLYFARLQAVAGAASGDTLAELRQQAPLPSTAAVAAALMGGVARTVSAGPESRVTTEFMRALTAADQPATWASLNLQSLSPAALAADPALRLAVADQFALTMPWPQAIVFEGVFAAGSGTRVRAPLLRLTGALRGVTDATMKADVMAATSGRWLVRITPTASVPTWTADDLAAAVARAVELALGSTAPAAEGSIVLPIIPTFRALGLDDVRGMQSAQDPARANLRALDGQGGTHAQLPTGSAGLGIGPQGLSVFGSSATYFVAGKPNTAGGGGGVQSISPLPPVPCAATDLVPGYLALVNRVGGIDMLARYTAVDGAACL